MEVRNPCYMVFVGAPYITGRWSSDASPGGHGKRKREIEILFDRSDSRTRMLMGKVAPTLVQFCWVYSGRRVQAEVNYFLNKDLEGSGY